MDTETQEEIRKAILEDPAAELREDDHKETLMLKIGRIFDAVAENIRTDDPETVAAFVEDREKIVNMLTDALTDEPEQVDPYMTIKEQIAKNMDSYLRI